jgi:hypothetical protein
LDKIHLLIHAPEVVGKSVAELRLPNTYAFPELSIAMSAGKALAMRVEYTNPVPPRFSFATNIVRNPVCELLSGVGVCRYAPEVVGNTLASVVPVTY